MLINPKLFEINTRVWLRRFDSAGKKARLADVPKSYWENLSKKGFDLIWLMGIWKTCSSVIERCCFQESLVNTYDKALKDWTKEDVIGSPYAVDKYEINPSIGSENDLQDLRNVLNGLGMKLIVDFIPNHFSADSEILKTNPEIFVECSEDCLKKEPHTFFRDKNTKKIYAHGRDPFFPAWSDTVQVNYFNPDARKFMLDSLKKISKMADGVRCDMAMLILNNVFSNTWRGIINIDFIPTDEFWEIAIREVKKVSENFIFIAEAYWDLEWNLQQQGFDFTYDKRLLDRLKDGTPQTIRDHLKAEYDFQIKSMRFIENHDEDRAAASFGIEKSLAAAIIISTVQGMRFYYDGQFEGVRIKLPLQLGREPQIKINKSVWNFYQKLLEITNCEVFKKGNWKLIEPLQIWENNFTNDNVIAYSWSYKKENRIVVVNYSNITSQCRLKFELMNSNENIIFTDFLNNKSYRYSLEELQNEGLFIELVPWHSHIFTY
jgi:glycosidase